jgi:CDP-glycerol glycerophosphotransferase (TagB/SpsB family)
MLSELTREFDVIGHGHPRIMNHLRQIYKLHKIPVYADWKRVMRKADIYVCDNSSTIYEFAYLRKPVVLLNADEYRKHVNHEGNPRFWKHADVGPQVDKPVELNYRVWKAWDDYKLYLPRIDAANKEIFTYLDGRCSERAVKAIVEMIDSNTSDI